MARPLLPLLCATVVLLLPWTAADTVPPQCGRPKDVANAHIDVGNNVLLNTRLRYTCNPGYKRKAGTSSLIQCILRDGSSEPDWTHTTLQCILSIQTLASSIGKLGKNTPYFGKQRARRDYAVAATAVPMMALAAENEEMSPPNIFPTG
ncbi:hypothetical protein Q9233_013282 [Columba guinea]|nr:hypothetical protein Q9233_013282 [Columba guinea]